MIILKYDEIKQFNIEKYDTNQNDLIIPSSYYNARPIQKYKIILTNLKIDIWTWEFYRLYCKNLYNLALYALYCDDIVPMNNYTWNERDNINYIRRVKEKKNLLDIIDEHDVIIAGGYLSSQAIGDRYKDNYYNNLCSSQYNYPNDIDLFPTQSTNINNLINDIQDTIDAGIEYYIVKTNRTITFKSPKNINLQISLSRCDDMKELFQHFDFDASKICYWKGEIYMTDSCLRSLSTNTIVVHQTDKFNCNTVNRLLKYNKHKYFRIIFKDVLSNNINGHSLIYKFMIKYQYKNSHYRGNFVTMYDIEPIKDNIDNTSLGDSKSQFNIESGDISSQNHKFLKAIYTDLYYASNKNQIIFLKNNRDILQKTKYNKINIIELFSSLYTSINTYSGKDNFYEYIPNYDYLIVNMDKIMNIELEPFDEKFQFKSVMENLEKNSNYITLNGNIRREVLNDLLPMIPIDILSIIYDYYTFSSYTLRHHKSHAASSIVDTFIRML